MLEVEDKSPRQKRTKKVDKSHTDQINYEEIAMSLIRSGATALTELEGELKK